MINIGNDGIAACRALNTNEHFLAFISALREQAQVKANSALDASPENQPLTVGYARAMRDLYSCIVQATHGTAPNKIGKPGALKDGA
jgi:hypothetical protein